MIGDLLSEVHRLDERIAQLQGVGETTATALVAMIGNGHEFKSARQLAAWLGLVPGQYSSGGRQRLGRITKAGDPYLRSLLVLCARPLLNAAKGKSDSVSRGRWRWPSAEGTANSLTGSGHWRASAPGRQWSNQHECVADRTGCKAAVDAKGRRPLTERHDLGLKPALRAPPLVERLTDGLYEPVGGQRDGGAAALWCDPARRRTSATTRAVFRASTAPL